MARLSPTMSGMGNQSAYSIERFRQTNGPLIDLRSPSEFSQGHWPGAINLPLFNDEQRASVGTAYKHKGRNAAILSGLKFTGPTLESLANKLKKFAETSILEAKQNDPLNLRLYCWRGGMRSACVAWLASLLDLNPILLEGGYKTYRRWVLNQFQKEWPLRLLGGKTGTGKTDLLKVLSEKEVLIIDLEGIASHRGSTFGALGLPAQPTSEHFENRLAEALDKHSLKLNCSKEIVLEAESSHLGRCRIPTTFFKQMQCAPILEVKRSTKERVDQLVGVYSQHEAESLEEATLRISRRLGPQRTTKAIQAISTGQWEEACLAMLDYYDRCYEHELEKAIKRESFDISGLTAVEAAHRLIEKGIIS